MTGVDAQEPDGGMTWADFEAGLTAGIERMAIESFLILELPSDGAGERAYIQFAHWQDKDDESLHLRFEAAGSDNLPTTRPLTPVQEERLAELGWRAPGPGEVVRNFVYEWDAPLPIGEIAALAGRTLREVYGIGHPDELRFRYALFDGSGEDDDIDVGLLPREQARRDTPKPRVREAHSSAPALDIEPSLRKWFGPDSLGRDVDGDFPVRVGSAIVYVRILPEAIALFSCVLEDVEPTAALHAALNSANSHARYARVFWVGGRIIAAAELPAIGASGDQVATACAELGHLADRLDDVLHGRFGGIASFGAPETLIH